MRFLQLLLAVLTTGNENGKARLPPMGWRSWNLYHAAINQSLIEGVMEEMVLRKRTVDGVPTSYCDLGYCDVGIDEGWAKKGGLINGNRCHDINGSPIVDLVRFPSLKNFTAKAHSLGLTAGWYGNGCGCCEHNTSDKMYYVGDVKAFREYDFDSYKLDGCGAQTDMQLWDDIFKADGGRAVTVENCHWGSRVPYEPTRTWCPWNFYRSSGDVNPSWGSIMRNLDSVTKYSSQNLSYPGCWAYPDMLEVGTKYGWSLTTTEARSHFGAWVIVSSPLTLGHDTRNKEISDEIWPIISNKEAIAVSQTYAGFSGGPFSTSGETVTLSEIDYSEAEKYMSEEKIKELKELGPYEAQTWVYLYKPLNYEGTEVAVLLINNQATSEELTVKFADVPGLKGPHCNVRDIWERKDIGTEKVSTMTFTVASHDSVFLKLSGCSPSEGNEAILL